MYRERDFEEIESAFPQLSGPVLAKRPILPSVKFSGAETEFKIS